MQMGWTHATELGVIINNTPHAHLLCHVVLPHSNWECATRCQSESLLSLRHGLQEALHRLGKVPHELRVGNSSSATHRIGGRDGGDFNPKLVSICTHYGLEPRIIQVDSTEGSDDVELSKRYLKLRLTQQLLLRGSREFSSENAYDQFLKEVSNRSNDGRQAHLADELANMKPLPPTRLPEYDEVYCTVGWASTIRVKKVGYSVPARLIGTELKVEIYEHELKLYSGCELLLTLPRQCGDRGVRLDYRHVIDHLLREPVAFERYRYRVQLFLSPVFRTAHEQLVLAHGASRGGVEYLRLLKLASEVGEADVEFMLSEFTCPPYPPWSVDQLRQWLQPRPVAHVAPPTLQPQCTGITPC